ncbi:MAG: TIGR04283 family arsenosugar biosynthesis glycosyltransferase [Suipraeoptans sp.]
MKKAIIIFTRIPVAGKTKTRLQPEFAPEESKKFHLCCLKDLNNKFKNGSEDIIISFAAGGDVNILRTIFGDTVSYISQVGENLGERMFNSIRHTLKMYDRCVLIGTDIPEVEYRDINKAFELLNEKDVVFGPTVDGGYYLVGMNKPIDKVFETKSYGHDSVLQDTICGLDEGIRIGLTKVHEDIDTINDINKMLTRMKKNRHTGKSHVFNYLLRRQKISVIIPIYNEEKTIDRILQQLDKIKDQCEILFVDGGSTDATLSKLNHRRKVISSAKGRAIQMNEGAKHSTGDILFFLHADSQLPSGAINEIREVMRTNRVGGFGISFKSKNFFMHTNQWISNHRMKHRRIIFGDQGMFIERELFFKLGMFPNLPIMEDYRFSLTMRKCGIEIGSTKHHIVTDDRRYPKTTIGKLKMMYKMARLRSMYRREIDINQIAKAYKDIR